MRGSFFFATDFTDLHGFLFCWLIGLPQSTQSAQRKNKYKFLRLSDLRVLCGEYLFQASGFIRHRQPSRLDNQTGKNLPHLFGRMRHIIFKPPTHESKGRNNDVICRN